MTPRTLLTLTALLCACAGCLPSSVVAPEDRAAYLEPEILPWAPLAEGAAIDGLYASVSIEGDASLGVLKLYYNFTSDGAFTGAALLATEPPTFQVLSGRWEIGPEGLQLGENAPSARVETAPDHLRLSGNEGIVVLRRERVF